MATALMRQEPVQPTEQDARAAQHIDAVLHAQRAPRSARLIAPTGEHVELPEAVYSALHQVVHLLAQGRAVAIIPYSKMLTTQQAAELLNVSRPYLVSLLEAGKIPFQRVGTHRRIRFNDLLQYRTRRDEERRQKLAHVTRLSQKLGLYGKR